MLRGSLPISAMSAVLSFMHASAHVECSAKGGPQFATMLQQRQVEVVSNGGFMPASALGNHNSPTTNRC